MVGPGVDNEGVSPQKQLLRVLCVEDVTLGSASVPGIRTTSINAHDPPGAARKEKRRTPGTSTKCPVGVHAKDHPASSMAVKLRRSADAEHTVHATVTWTGCTPRDRLGRERVRRTNVDPGATTITPRCGAEGAGEAGPRPD